MITATKPRKLKVKTKKRRGRYTPSSKVVLKLEQGILLEKRSRLEAQLGRIKFDKSRAEETGNIESTLADIDKRLNELTESIKLRNAFKRTPY